MSEKPATVDGYIASCPGAAQAKLNEIREILRQALPEAAEKISWAMPTFYNKGNVAHFAAHKKHIGFYPGAAAMKEFAPRLEGYVHSKGAVQFPMDKELPRQLIIDMARFSQAENLSK